MRFDSCKRCDLRLVGGCGSCGSCKWCGVWGGGWCGLRVIWKIGLFWCWGGFMVLLG